MWHDMCKHLTKTRQKCFGVHLMTAAAYPLPDAHVEPDMDAVCDFLARVPTDDPNSLLEIAYLCLRDIREFRSKVRRKPTRSEMQGIADVIALAWAALDIAQEISLDNCANSIRPATAH